jgi:hypothetical protein
MKKYLFTVRNKGFSEKHIVGTKSDVKEFDFHVNNGEVFIIEKTDDKITFKHNNSTKSVIK